MEEIFLANMRQNINEAGLVRLGTTAAKFGKALLPNTWKKAGLFGAFAGAGNLMANASKVQSGDASSNAQRAVYMINSLANAIGNSPDISKETRQVLTQCQQALVQIMAPIQQQLEAQQQGANYSGYSQQGYNGYPQQGYNGYNQQYYGQSYPASYYQQQYNYNQQAYPTSYYQR